jgi:hypothetical protein
MLILRSPDCEPFTHRVERFADLEKTRKLAQRGEAWGTSESRQILLAIRDSTYSGRPLGSAESTRALEREAHRRLTPQKRGPKKRPEPGQEQAIFSFDPL